MTKLSALEDAKVKLAAYEEMEFVTWSDDVVHGLLDTIKDLVEEVEYGNWLYDLSIEALDSAIIRIGWMKKNMNAMQIKLSKER